MIYLDNNSTTLMPVEVKKALITWCNRGNPSSGYASANSWAKVEFLTSPSSATTLGSRAPSATSASP